MTPIVMVDRRAGSVDLVGPLREVGVEVEVTTLAAGDVEWVGKGPKGPVFVGVEYKKWADALTCMRNGRFAEQARQMRKAFEVSWLLLEGDVRVMGPRNTLHTRGRDRRWEEAHGGYGYQEAVAWLTTMASRAGMLLWRTHDLRETVLWLRAQHLWWTAKEWEEHRSHLDFYTPPESVGEMLEEPSYVQKVASVLPGIGTMRAAAVAVHFATIKDMVAADATEWRKVKGVGPKVAATLIGTIEGKGGRR